LTFWPVITVGALFALFALMHFLTRRASRSVGQLGALGTVSQRWLNVHRAEDQ
jgi:hypothetical protein